MLYSIIYFGFDVKNKTWGIRNIPAEKKSSHNILVNYKGMQTFQACYPRPLVLNLPDSDRKARLLMNHREAKVQHIVIEDQPSTWPRTFSGLMKPAIGKRMIDSTTKKEPDSSTVPVVGRVHKCVWTPFAVHD